MVSRWPVEKSSENARGASILPLVVRHRCSVDFVQRPLVAEGPSSKQVPVINMEPSGLNAVTGLYFVPSLLITNASVSGAPIASTGIIMDQRTDIGRRFAGIRSRPITKPGTISRSLRNGSYVTERLNS